MDKTGHNEIAIPAELFCTDIVPLKWPEVEKALYEYDTMLPEDDDDDEPCFESLMLLFVDNRYGLSIEADEEGDIRLRYDPETGDVHGMEIDDFENHFLKKRPELAAGWAALKPAGKNGFHRTPWLTDAPALDYARRLKDLAYQGTQSPGWPFIESLESILAQAAALQQHSPQLSRPDNGDGGGA